MPQYSTRAQRKRRTALNPLLRQSILNRDAGICYYCGFEANEVDHIIPVSYGGTDDEDNLIACCDICNKIANNKVFDTLEAKGEYVREKYGPYLQGRLRRIRRKLSICADCQNVYSPVAKGATNVLCADCYDRDEKGVNGALIGEQPAVYHTQERSHDR